MLEVYELPLPSHLLQNVPTRTIGKKLVNKAINATVEAQWHFNTMQFNIKVFFFFFFQFNVPLKIISLIETSQSIGGAKRSIGGAKREYPEKTT